MSRHKKNFTVKLEPKEAVMIPEEKPLNTLVDATIEKHAEENPFEFEAVQTELDITRLELEKLKLELEEKKKEIGRLREVTPEEKKIIEGQYDKQAKDAHLKDEMERQRIYDSQLVTGKFINRRAPGNSVKLPYVKYATDPVKWYPFEDGKVYDIPRGFAEQINEHYYRPQFTQTQGAMDPNRPSSVIHEVDTSNKLYSFVPIGFAA